MCQAGKKKIWIVQFPRNAAKPSVTIPRLPGKHPRVLNYCIHPQFVKPCLTSVGLLRWNIIPYINY